MLRAFESGVTVDRKYGRIVNISSVMAILGRASVAGYVAAKHGMVGLTKVAAIELAEAERGPAKPRGK